MVGFFRPLISNSHRRGGFMIDEDCENYKDKKPYVVPDMLLTSDVAFNIREDGRNKKYVKIPD